MPLKGKWNVLQFLLPSISLRNFKRGLSPGPNTKDTVTSFREIFNEKFQIKNALLFFFLSPAMIPHCYKLKRNNTGEEDAWRAWCQVQHPGARSSTVAVPGPRRPLWPPHLPVGAAGWRTLLGQSRGPVWMKSSDFKSQVILNLYRHWKLFLIKAHRVPERNSGITGSRSRDNEDQPLLLTSCWYLFEAL